MSNTQKYFATRREWRAWLAEHFETARELWFVFPNKASGKQGVSYNDAVEEALCFGWIDSTVKSLDEHHRIQRFTPRKPKSPYSQLNKERLRFLINNQLIHPNLLEEIQQIVAEPFVFPNDIIQRLQADTTVWQHYERFPDSYKRIRIAYIDGARQRPEEFEKRLRHFISKTKENKLISSVLGTDKYYHVEEQ